MNPSNWDHNPRTIGQLPADYYGGYRVARHHGLTNHSSLATAFAAAGVLLALLRLLG